MEYAQPSFGEFEAPAGFPEMTDQAEMFDWLTHAPVGGNFWENDELGGFLEGAGGGEEGFAWMPET